MKINNKIVCHKNEERKYEKRIHSIIYSPNERWRGSQRNQPRNVPLIFFAYFFLIANKYFIIIIISSFIFIGKAKAKKLKKYVRNYTTFLYFCTKEKSRKKNS